MIRLESSGAERLNQLISPLILVTQRYHWADANAITTTDPVSGRKVAHAEFMHMLDFSLTGVTHDLAQGQVDSARKHYQDFRRRFTVLPSPPGARRPRGQRGWS